MKNKKKEKLLTKDIMELVIQAIIAIAALITALKSS